MLDPDIPRPPTPILVTSLALFGIGADLALLVALAAAGPTFEILAAKYAFVAACCMALRGLGRWLHRAEQDCLRELQDR